MSLLQDQSEYLRILPSSIQGKHTILLDHITSQSLEIQANSDLTIIALLTAGWEDHRELNFNFTGPNSTLKFIAINIGTDHHTFPFSTFSNHFTGHTNAYYHINSVLFDQSQVDYTGNLIIKKSAQQTDCYLSHNTLLLSPKAKVNTKPCLEIEADDVKAGHAATVGNLDEESLFYLKSRGLTDQQSKKLIVQGFLEKDLNYLESVALRETIITSITETISK